MNTNENAKDLLARTMPTDTPCKTLIIFTYTAYGWVELSREVFTDGTELLKSERWARYCGARTEIQDGDTKTEPK